LSRIVVTSTSGEVECERAMVLAAGSAALIEPS
jgi:hypothetical protein